MTTHIHTLALTHIDTHKLANPHSKRHKFTHTHTHTHTYIIKLNKNLHTHTTTTLTEEDYFTHHM